jgi:hypothetical protein
MGNVSLRDKESAIMRSCWKPILITACLNVVAGSAVLKKALLATFRRRIARDGSFSMRDTKSLTEHSSSDASSTSLMATTESTGKEYPDSKR